MRRILICTGVLGGGTALTFAAAALAASLFPSGATVYSMQPDIFLAKPGVFFGGPMEGGFAVPEPAIDLPLERIVVDAEEDLAVPG